MIHAVGDWYIDSDGVCFMVKKKCRPKDEKGKEKGKEYLKTLAYAGTMESAIDILIDLRDKETVQNMDGERELITAVRELRKSREEVRQALKGELNDKA